MSLCRHGDGACIFGTGTRRGARGSAAPRVSHESVCFTLLTETDHRPFQATMKTAARKKRRRDSVSICKQNKTRCDERAEGQLSARGGGPGLCTAPQAQLRASHWSSAGAPPPRWVPRKTSVRVRTSQNAAPKQGQGSGRAPTPMGWGCPQPAPAEGLGLKSKTHPSADGRSLISN